MVPSIRPIAPLILVLVGTGVVTKVFAGRQAADERPWIRMDYGPFLSISLGLGGDVPPVHKGVVVRLRTRAGEPTELHAVFDTDLLAWRCAWEGEVALRGIVYDGPHGTFPEIDGEPIFRTAAMPGVLASEGEPAGDPRDEPWGPVPVELAGWSGLHLDGDDVVFEYTTHGGRHRVLERVWAEPHGDSHAFAREITVATEGASAGAGPTLRVLEAGADALPNAMEGLVFGPDGITLRAPANGTVRLAVAVPGATLPEVPAAPATGVHDAIRRALPRWGPPLVTRGVVDDPLDAEREGRRITHRAGSARLMLDLVRADGGGLELLQGGEPAESAPVAEAVVLRHAPATEVRPWSEDDAIGHWPSDTGSGTHERNAFTDALDLWLDGVTWRRGVVGRALDFDGTAAAWLEGATIDLGTHDLTVAAWIHTTSDGTVFAVAPPEGNWAPDGATLFLRGGRLAFDVGWVGVVAGGPRVDDGAWHHVAASWSHESGGVRLFVDGERVAQGELPLLGGEEREAFTARFGWTNDNFPAVTRFSGYMDGLLVLRSALDHDGVRAAATATGEALAEATLVRSVHGDRSDSGAQATLRLDMADGERVVGLELAATEEDLVLTVQTRRGPRSVLLAWADEALRAAAPASRPFRVDRITWPDDNPHGSWMRFGAFDLLPVADGVAEESASAAIATWSGDVWRVDGLDEDLDRLVWTRVATGLNQPFGVAARGAELLVLGRDQITRLHDTNGDGEADFLENVTNAARNSEHFHEPASGLLVEPDGSLVFVKAARHAKLALHEHHGTALRVSPDGASTTVVARGFRAPIGLCRLPDGSLLCSDQEGHWTPANRINLIRPSASAPPFFGNGWAARTDFGERSEREGERVRPAWDADAPMVQPLCWLHPSVDRSPSTQVFVDHPAWGPLAGSILGLSYGTGEVYLVLRDDVPGANGSSVSQGGVVKLGIQLPTGLLAGRVHPATGDLYVCGLFGWSSDRTAPGGFYRVRPRTDAWARTLNVPQRVRAVADGLELTFLHPLDAAAATESENWSAEAWNYRRTADYGSATYALDGRRGARTDWDVLEARLADERTVRLVIEDFEPAMQVRVGWEIADARGRRLEHEAHLTVHDVHREND